MAGPNGICGMIGAFIDHFLITHLHRENELPNGLATNNTEKRKRTVAISFFSFFRGSYSSIVHPRTPIPFEPRLNENVGSIHARTNRPPVLRMGDKHQRPGRAASCTRAYAQRLRWPESRQWHVEFLVGTKFDNCPDHTDLATPIVNTQNVNKRHQGNTTAPFDHRRHHKCLPRRYLRRP